jgi:hypothetical protein
MVISMVKKKWIPVAIAATASGAFAGPNVDPKADELLHKMSNELATMKAFSVETKQVMEVVTKEGEMLQGIAESTVHLQRPNKLVTDRVGPMGGGKVYYDGKTLTVFGKRDNMYATSPAPPTLDAAIDFARDKLSIDAPAADLLNSNPYAVLTDDVVSGRYVGEEPIGDRMCHHLAYRGNETDFQIWVEDGPHALPCRFVITSKKVQGSPTYQVSLSDWKPENLAPDAFTFTPPPDATKISFVTLGEQKKGKR